MHTARQLLMIVLAVVSFNGCIHPTNHHSARTKITGRVVRYSTGHPVSGMSVRVLDVNPKFSPLGIVAPKRLGIAATNKHGHFEVDTDGLFRREQIAVEFHGASNTSAMEHGFRVVDVATAAIR